jgi:CRISPR-associated endonuclease/helicase Cas3
MERAIGKAERLLQIESLLLVHPEGLSQAEIARRLGVNRSTVYRCLPDLTSRFAVHETEDGRLAIDRDHYLMNVRLTLHESMALHLAARLMATRSDKQNPHAAAVLRKLGLALEELAPRVSAHLKSSAEVMEDQAQRFDPVYLGVLETLTRAWSDGRVARVWHRMEDGRVFEYRLAPYFIEPYAVGRTTHVIGWRRPPGALRTLKLERIQRAELTEEAYSIPPDFDPRETLADAWGIWYTEAEPVEVVLRFHPRVAGRVRETQWHRSERVDEQPDGSLIWRARVAEPREMLNWIQGWGSQVEVMAPEELRETVVEETARLALLYAVGEVQPPPLYQQLWAKTDQTHKADWTHSLVFHLLDVAEVVLALWDQALPESTRRYFAETLRMGYEPARRWVGFVAALHDLGKACPPFQGSYPPGKQALAGALSFPETGNVKTPHGWVSAYALRDLLPRQLGMARPVARQIAYAVGGHHGAFPSARNLDELGPARRGGEDWDAVREDLFEALAGLFDVRNLPPWPSDTAEDPAFWTLLAGLVSFSDWIGSIEEYFFRLDAPDLPTYASRAYDQAVLALERLGWAGYTPPEGTPDFCSLFGFAPRPLQEVAIKLATRLPTPALVIVEAPTGEGKTEAALYLADAWLRRAEQRGIYVAMPSQATSNQMLGRVRRYLAHRYTDRQANLLLLHGNAAWSKELEELRLAAINEEGESTVIAHSWFLLNKKRGLLAPFAVGTVDQALLSVLQTRHFFVRLFGLSHKTVVFDEVHAYDTYMGTLLQHLLRWLAAMGSTVILLSATLPSQTRRDLIKAYTGRDSLGQDAEPSIHSSACYPAMTWATSRGGEVLPLATSSTSTRTLALKWIANQPDILVAGLRCALGEGGCVAVICNTIGRAQELFGLLQAEHLVPEKDLILFHARFPFAWRQGIEEQVLAQQAIVVATQVIEQSLDLDFDLMISHMAPVDLLLQRAGRLHRHKRESRPTPLSTPHFWVLLPEMQEGVPRWGNDGKIYAPYVLLRSYLALRERETLTVPDDVPALIAAVYDDPEVLPRVANPTVAQALEEAYAKMLEQLDRQEHQAQTNLIAWPDDEDVFNTRNKQLDEDNPELHEAWRALTRLTRPNVTLVCLHRQVDGRLTLEPEGQTPVDLTRKPDRELATLLAQQAVAVSDYRVVKHFLAEEPSEGWREHALLRYYRAAIFEEGRCMVQDTVLTLDRRRGLVITRNSAP